MTEAQIAESALPRKAPVAVIPAIVQVVENDRDNLSVTFAEKRAGHARRAAARQCDFLPERKLRQACEQLIFALRFSSRKLGKIATCTRSIK